MYEQIKYAEIRFTLKYITHYPIDMFIDLFFLHFPNRKKENVTKQIFIDLLNRLKIDFFDPEPFHIGTSICVEKLAAVARKPEIDDLSAEWLKMFDKSRRGLKIAMNYYRLSLKEVVRED